MDKGMVLIKVINKITLEVNYFFIESKYLVELNKLPDDESEEAYITELFFSKIYGSEECFSKVIEIINYMGKNNIYIVSESSFEIEQEIDKIIQYIYAQFKKSTTVLGEPQAWVKLKKGRLIEIVEEREGLKKEEYYYSCKLHSSDKEYKEYKDTIGIIDTFVTKSLSKKELTSTVKRTINASNTIFK